jgi:hypothetical protein
MVSRRPQDKSMVQELQCCESVCKAQGGDGGDMEGGVWENAGRGMQGGRV